MPESLTAIYVADVEAAGRRLRLCSTSTLEGDVVATVHDVGLGFSVLHDSGRYEY